VDALAQALVAQALTQGSASASAPASHADVSSLATPVGQGLGQGLDQDLADGHDDPGHGASTPFSGGAGSGLGAGAGSSALLPGGPQPIKALMVRSGTGSEGAAADGLSRWNAERGMSAIIERMDLLKADLMVGASCFLFPFHPASLWQPCRLVLVRPLSSAPFPV
jgi:hypothetical protein